MIAKVPTAVLLSPERLAEEREGTVARHQAAPVMTLWPQPNDFEHSPPPSSSSSESPMWEEVISCGRRCPYAYDGECDDGGSVRRAASNPHRLPMRVD
jgi:hypothetical protein